MMAPDITRERILHLWDIHVGEPTVGRPLTDHDKVNFAKAVLYRAAQQPVQEGADCDQAFEEHYKCSARDPSNAGDLAKFRDGWTAAVTAAANLYGQGDVAAPVGNSAWGEARQGGWIDGTWAYRDAIRRLGEEAGRGGNV
jgi:hypothetical protein